MIYSLYFFYRYYSIIYYILSIYHSYRISYDVYNGGKYIYEKIPKIINAQKEVKMNGFEVKEIKNEWQYIDIY